MTLLEQPDHLNETSFSYLGLSEEERIEKIRTPVWIPYPRAEEIHAELQDYLNYPKNSRMPNALVCATSNGGKSRLIEVFVERANKGAGTEEEPRLPVLAMQAPPEPDLRDFYGLCLEKLHAPFRPKERPNILRAQLSRLLNNLKTRMLVVDEVHHLIAGSSVKQRVFLNTLKFLSNDLQIPIVIVGTRAALVALQIDVQINNRFRPLPLPPWKEGVLYRALLASFELATPLREPSDLVNDRMAAKLLAMSEGLIGEMAEIIRRTAVAAVRSGEECITYAALDSLPWVLPSLRRPEAMKEIK